MDTHENGQRKFPRIASRHSVLVQKVEGNVEEFARTRSVSPGGCGFLSAESLGIGAVLNLLISVERSVIQARARVIYELPTDDGRFEVGAEFLEMKPEDRHVINRLLESPVAIDE